jgi:hypothetical protein
MNTRRIADINIGTNYGVKIIQILSGFLYSISGKIIAAIVITFLNMIYYEDVINLERMKKEIMMVKIEKKYIKNEMTKLNLKLKIAKIRVFFCVKLALHLKHLKYSDQIKKISTLYSNITYTRIPRNDQTNQIEMKHLNNSISLFTPMSNEEQLYKIKKWNEEAMVMIHNKRFNNLEIKSEINFSIDGELGFNLNENYTSHIHIRDRNFVFNYKELNIKFELKDGDNVILIPECSEFTITVTNKVFSSTLRRIIIKTVLIVLIYVILTAFIGIIIQDVHQTYGKQVINICFVPFISIFFTSIFITANIMIFIGSVLAYYKGKYFFTNYMHPIMKLLVKILGLQQTLHHLSILMFREFIQYIE